MVVLAFAIIYLVWGASFLAIRIGVAAMPPLLMMGIRFTIAGAVLLGWAVWRGERTGVRAWGPAAVVGVLMFVGAYAPLAWAEQRLPSGLAALLVATVPFWLVLFEWRQTRPSRTTIVGLTLGLAGVGILMGGDVRQGGDWARAAAVLAGEASWAAGVVYARSRLPESTALRSGMPMFAGGALLLLWSYAIREAESFDVRAVPASAVAALAYLIVFASIVAFFAYTWLLKRMPASLVGTHAYVNPLVAVALGVTFGGEPLTRPLLVGAAVIAASVAIVLRRAVPQPRRMVLDRQADGVVPAQRVRRPHASLRPDVSKLSP